MRGRTRAAPTWRALVVALLAAVALGCLIGCWLSAGPRHHDPAAALLAANRFERLVEDLEESEAGYLATGDESSLRPWHRARADLPRQTAALERLATADGPDQERRAHAIVHAATSYLREHAEPLVDAARHDRAGARARLVRAEGRRRVMAIRAQLDGFAEAQHRLVLAHERGAVRTLREALAAAAGVAGSVLLVLLAAGVGTRHPLGELAWTPGGRLRRIAGEREALHRVATHVAAEATPDEVAGATARAMGEVLRARQAVICRYEADGSALVAGCWSAPGTTATTPVGALWPGRDGGAAAVVRETGRPARLRRRRSGADGWPPGVHLVVGHPIMAAGRLWGVAVVLTPGPRRRPDPALAEFAALVSIAVENARRRSKAAASRVRLVEAADAARRRVERDLHERAQQQLVAVGIELSAAERAVPPDLEELRVRLADAAGRLTETIEGLQDLARRVYPAFLLRRGLEPALRTLVRRAAAEAELETHGRRPPAPNVAMTVYYVVSEALTNVTMHARASVVRIRVDLAEEVRLRIEDDGVGGARPYAGSSLSYLRERIEALGGELVVHSPPGAGTRLVVTLAAEPAADGEPTP
jgi:signal transduction histidine kinase